MFGYQDSRSQANQIGIHLLSIRQRRIKNGSNQHTSFTKYWGDTIGKRIEKI